MPPAPSCTSAASSRLSSKFTPPDFKGFHCVGWTQSAHGIRGELYVQLYAKQADWLDDVEDISLLTPGSKTLETWPIEACRPHKDGLILKLKGVDDRNRSEELRKSGVYIDEGLLSSEYGDEIYLKQIEGFTLEDMEGIALGKIVGFATNGVQDLLRIERADGPEVLVPFVQAFLRNIDFDKHRVTMDLPQGLFDLDKN